MTVLILMTSVIDQALVLQEEDSPLSKLRLKKLAMLFKFLILG